MCYISARVLYYYDEFPDVLMSRLNSHRMSYMEEHILH